ncbi:MAG: hypothetical protein EHM32_08515 [Spirochaetales bacterium]|nr:MAG: hypothetical protein EHM32_08515 [Spirochaetales bacterium]
METAMRTCCAIVLTLAIITAVYGCKKKERNEVQLDQIEMDRSTNYRFIFRETIDRETEKSRKGKKDPFVGE